jgi:hypothetical protein
MSRTIHCTTCWASFEVNQLRYIAEHPTLVSDPVAGEDAMLRFRPSIFDNRGSAIDPEGSSCSSVACPKCRCEFPNKLLYDEILPISVVGSPASGKSCLLASGLRSLRRLGSKLGYTLIDAAPSLNTHIHELEEKLFPRGTAESSVHIGKTDPSDLSAYKQIIAGKGEISVPRPIHYTWRDGNNQTRTVVFHDTAGEAFTHKNKMSSAIEHLAASKAIIFVLDPLQDPSTRHLLNKNDPQIDLFEKGGSSRQDLLILESADRIRKLKGLSNKDRLDIPMIIAVNKYDAWASLLKEVDLSNSPLLRDKTGGYSLDEQLINDVNTSMRDMLYDHLPDWMDAIDSFAANPIIIPCAPLGIAPDGDEFGALQINTSALSPVWADIPFLLAIQHGLDFEHDALTDSAIDQL